MLKCEKGVLTVSEHRSFQYSKDIIETGFYSHYYSHSCKIIKIDHRYMVDHDKYILFFISCLGNHLSHPLCPRD